MTSDLSDDIEYEAVTEDAKSQDTYTIIFLYLVSIVSMIETVVLKSNQKS